MNYKKKGVLGVVSARIQRQFYSPCGEFYCFAVIFELRSSYIAFGS